MATRMTYKHLFPALSALLGAELGIYLAGAHLVPAADTALRSMDPPFAVLWAVASLLVLGATLITGGLGLAVGRKLSGPRPRPAAAPAEDTEEAYPSGVGAVA